MAAPGLRSDTRARELTVTDDIGGCLRRARKERALSLSDLAARTKLAIHVLQAIERNQFDRLPGGIFRKAYVRMLASEVGLDPEQMAARYCAEFEPSPAPPPVEDSNAAVQAKWIEQLTPPRRSILMLIAVAAPAAAWFALQPGPLPPAVMTPVGADQSVAPAPAITLVHTSGTDREVVPPRRTMPIRIEIAAIGPSWITADADGDRVTYRLIEPGERLTLEANALISLRLGDAAAVLISINDGAPRSFGGHGEVIDLAVTPDNVDSLRSGAETASGG